MKKLHPTFLALLLIGIILLVMNVVAELNSSLIDQQAAQDEKVKAALIRTYSPMLGQADAPVTIVKFFDPTCEACSTFYPIVKGVLAEHPNDVRLVLRYALFHPGSEEVARILEASRKQDLFLEVLEAVLVAQPKWHDDPKVLSAWNAAAAAGLDVDQARADMFSPAIDVVLVADKQDVKTVGVRAVPAFFVNGRPLQKLGIEPLYDLVSSEITRDKNSLYAY